MGRSGKENVGCSSEGSRLKLDLVIELKGESELELAEWYR